MAKDYGTTWERLKNWWSGGGTGAGPAAGAVAPQVGPAATMKQAAIRDEYRVRAAKAAMGESLTARMSLAERKLRAYDNQLHPLVLAKLKENFHPANFDRMALMPSVWTNPLRRIVDELSTLYESPARRTLKAKTADASPTAEDGTRATQAGAAGAQEGEDEEGQDDTDAGAGGDELADGALSPEDIGTGDPEIDALAEVLEALDIRAPGDDAETPFEQVMRLADLDVVLDKVEKLARFQPVVWVRPYVSYSRNLPPDAQTGEVRPDAASAKLDYLIYTPDVAWAVMDPENRKVMQAFCYFTDEFDMQTGGIARRINFWNSETFYKFDLDWNVISTAPNPYRRIPAVAFRSDLAVRSAYLDGVGDDLYEGTLELCVLRTIENTRARDAGFKQLALQNVSPEDVPADQVMGGPTPIYTGDGNATVLDLHPYLSEFSKLVSDRAQEMAAKYGISAAEWKQEGTPQSGFAKRLDRDKILKENRRIRKFFIESEKELYRLLAVTVNHHPIGNIGKLDEEAELEVDFAEPTFTEDPKSQASTDAHRLKMNLDSIIDLLGRDNPDLDEASLVRLAYRNKRINEALMTSDQVRLTDILATRAIAGASLDSGGGAPPGAKGKGFPAKEDEGDGADE